MTTNYRPAIIIPARYGSSRLPGKPLVPIAGKTMLSRVVSMARAAIASSDNAQLYVATDDTRIVEHCDTLDVASIMTDSDCISGTDRVAQAAKQLHTRPTHVLNLQGDAPLTPPHVITTMIDSLGTSDTDIVTPVTQLDWNTLDIIRQQKKHTPFSGTFAVFHPQTWRAYWFSKHIIPSIRDEAAMRQITEFSPAYRHIGLYGYTYDALQTFASLSSSHYEDIEQLEQLRALEHGLSITCCPIELTHMARMSGVDSPEDVIRAEALLAEHGEIDG